MKGKFNKLYIERQKKENGNRILVDDILWKQLKIIKHYTIVLFQELSQHKINKLGLSFAKLRSSYSGKAEGAIYTKTFKTWNVQHDFFQTDR